MDLFDLFVRIVVDTGDAEKTLPSVTNKISSLAGGLKTGLVTAAKAGAVAIGAAATAVTALGNAAIENYAEYEQLVGGVETLFKQSAGIVQYYADNAYKTAGMSANEYMSTVTSFSASLLQGVGGDTEKAAEIANRAITDMSDNANKMGTDMSLIQNAYQGFAKQNYTMLDNLKLGYGGTQAEMARLINESGVLGDTMTVTAETVNQVSFDKIIEAIGVVQDRMGITGTTAAEAASTIQGSVGMMQTAWQNLVTGIADPEQDIGRLVGNFVDSVITVADNLVPRINELLPRIAEGISLMATELMPHVVSVIETLLPGLVDGAASLLNAFTAVLPQILAVAMDVMPQLIDAAVIVLENLVTALVDNLPLIVEGAVEIIGALAAALVSMIPDLAAKGPAIIEGIAKGLINGLPAIVEVGEMIVKGIGAGLDNMLDWIVSKTKKLAANVADAARSSLGIHSPSTVFAGIGENMALGLGEGWESEYDRIKRQIDGGLQFGTASVDFASSGLGMTSANIAKGISNAAGTSGDIVINITEEVGGTTVAQKQYRFNQEEVMRRGASLIGGMA